MTDPAVTVHVPFYGDKKDLRRCVDSLLAQTFGNIRILVVGDGMRVPKFDDPRVVTYSMSKNRGAYFARAVMLAATDTMYTAIVDADDWVEPEWLESLFKAMRNDDAALQYAWHEERGGAEGVVHYPRVKSPPSARFTHITSHTGLYRTEALKTIGYNPAYRMGWDTLMVMTFRLVYRMAFAVKPLYHRVVKPDSLTQDPRTGLRSKARGQNAAVLAGIYYRVWQNRTQRDRVVQIVQDEYDPEIMQQVQEHAERLRAKW